MLFNGLLCYLRDSTTQVWPEKFQSRELNTNSMPTSERTMADVLSRISSTKFPGSVKELDRCIELAGFSLAFCALFDGLAVRATLVR